MSAGASLVSLGGLEANSAFSAEFSVEDAHLQEMYLLAANERGILIPFVLVGRWNRCATFAAIASEISELIITLAANDVLSIRLHMHDLMKVPVTTNLPYAGKKVKFK